ncbi:MAG: TerB family tellurite resistance protein [Deltaproteobacteria bacterium]|nr:TerB family tellurite resistance protein [Deltaproteobacteria bacterium]
MVSDFFVDQDLSFEQVKALSHAMMAVARVDGVHESEMALVRGFYEGCSGRGDPSLEEVCAGPFDIAAKKSLFASPELAQMFIKSLILLAFADGQCSKPEDEAIRAYALVLGLSSEAVDQLFEATKEFLMSGLAHVENLEALKEVRRKLDPA